MQFWFFLATRFGLPVAVLKRVMPYAEFVQHVAYHNLHPYGDDWNQSALIAWASLDVHNRRRVKPDQLKPSPIRTKPAQSPEYIASFFMQMARDAEARRKANGRT